MSGHCGLWWEFIKQINIKTCWTVELPLCSPLVIHLFQGKLWFPDTFKRTKGIAGQQKANMEVHSVKLWSWKSCFTLPLQKSTENTVYRSRQAELWPDCRWCAISEGNVKKSVFPGAWNRYSGGLTEIELIFFMQLETFLSHS